MTFTELPLKGSYVVDLDLFSDDRGWFARTFCKNEFEAIGHNAEWVQMNHSFTRHKGTIRGMHYQLPPFTEIKMVRCIAGAVYDVIVDIRKDSATFLKWAAVELSAANKKMIVIPAGFAHGFQALEDNSELIYNHSQFYMPGVEGGILYNDTAINIEWPLPVGIISDRDKQHPEIDHNFKGI
ncbi:MAG: dTDP-4-dehydrorhamnose 3,5-epimerase [Pedobacter sp.]|nr:MAG: dTDP-4-dehydrorhamnose 3,5-epimerase [Pedobacter sp.]